VLQDVSLQRLGHTPRQEEELVDVELELAGERAQEPIRRLRVADFDSI
jgi:hypothetical protein